MLKLICSLYEITSHINFLLKLVFLAVNTLLSVSSNKINLKKYGSRRLYEEHLLLNFNVKLDVFSR